MPVAGRVNAADKVNDERLRYYNGVAEARGANNLHGFDSSNFKCVWPTSRASSGDGGAGAPTGAFATAPAAGSVPGIRSRTLEGVRHPVPTATGGLAFPEPSPGKGRRRPALDGAPPAYGSVPPPSGIALVDHLVLSEAGLSTAEGAPVAVAFHALHTAKAGANVQQSKLTFSDAGLTATEEPGRMGSGGRVFHSVGGGGGAGGEVRAPLGAFNRAGVDAQAAMGAPSEVVATTEARYMRTVAPLPKGGKRHTGSREQQQGGEMAECLRG